MDAQKPQIDRRVFRRAPWGPARLVSTQGETSVRLGNGPTVSIRSYGVKPVTPTMGYGGTLEAGVPILVDGEQKATAYSQGREWAGIIKPGTIRIEGDDPDFTPPGLHLRGHLLPQRLSLKVGKRNLVASPPIIGLANLHTGPLLWVKPRVSPEAKPEHIALWIAAWLEFESAY